MLPISVDVEQHEKVSETGANIFPLSVYAKSKYSTE